MKIRELIEARRNPEQNPKVSINNVIYDAVKAANGNDIAGTSNIFVSFTTVDKLGINPKSEYNTPLGIYAYPGEYVYKEIGLNKPTYDLPFAGDNKYVNLFSAAGNIINIATISEKRLRNIIKRLLSYGQNIQEKTGRLQ